MDLTQLCVVISLVALHLAALPDSVIAQRAAPSPYIVVESVKPEQQDYRSTARYGLTRDDHRRLNNTIRTIQQAVPVRTIHQETRYGAKATNARIVGSSEALSRVFKLKLSRGRFLTENDENKLNNVAVIGSAVSRTLFPYQDPIGKNIRIGDHYFLVVGQTATVGRLSDAPRGVQVAADSDVYIPISTMRSRLGDRAVTITSGIRELQHFELSQIWIIVDQPANAWSTGQTISRLLERFHETRDYSITLGND